MSSESRGYRPLLWMTAIALYGSGSWMLAQSAGGAPIGGRAVDVATAPDAMMYDESCGDNSYIMAAPQELPNASWTNLD